MGSSPAIDAPETSQPPPGRDDDSSRPAPPRVAPAVNLRAYALAGIASHVSSGGSLSEESREVQFLLAHLAAVDPEGKGWAAGLPDYLRRPGAHDALLFYCARELGLTVVETLAVALAASVEEDVMIGRALAYLQSPVGGSRPTLGLIAASFDETAGDGEKPINLLLSGAAVRSGLLVLGNEGPPLPERTASVPLHLCLALNGYDGSLAGTRVGLGRTPEVPLPDSVLDEARKHSLSLLNSDQKVLVVRTGSTAEGETLAARLAEATGRRALFVETEKTASLCPWLILRRLLPVFRFELAPGERKILPALPFYSGPVLALCGPDGSVEAAGGTALSWTLQVPREDERALLWRSALGDEQLARSLARHHRHGSGRIAHLGRLARHRGAARGRALPAAEDVAAASWVGEGSGLDALAQPVAGAIPDEALVVPPLLREELRTLLLRCRARDQLSSGLGASVAARYHPGVRALFVGPSGTGKTLAAGWLATKLGIPLYRVDLASVTSKYIGETEKNLSQLLARAESSEVLLLFDEADSLFGKRTDVREANDRFANAQTNYLLQRLESFDGITLLTSNSRARFDTALARRLDMIVEFPAPGPEERRSLWQSHLGPNHRLAQKELNQLSAAADLCGGHIRNVVLMAALLAHEEERPVEYRDVNAGLVSEYRKLGRQLPVELKLG